MKIDPTIPFLSVEGTPLTKDDTPNGEPVTLGWLIASALAAVPPAENDKFNAFDRFMLAGDFYKATGPLDVTPEKLVAIRDAVKKRWPQPVLSGQALGHLDAKD